MRPWLIAAGALVGIALIAVGMRGVVQALRAPSGTLQARGGPADPRELSEMLDAVAAMLSPPEELTVSLPRLQGREPETGALADLAGPWRLVPPAQLIAQCRSAGLRGAVLTTIDTARQLEALAAARPALGLRRLATRGRLVLLRVINRPRIVLVVLDTLRPDHLGFLGYSHETAPFLAGLACRSVVFTHAFSTSSWTAPATASLYTSRYPTRHHVTEGFVANQGRQAASGASVILNRLPVTAPVLPELLSQAGYQTLGLSANINIGPEIGFDRGFDRLERLVSPAAPSQKVDAEALASRLDQLAAEARWRSLRPGTDLPEAEHASRAAPLFLYLHFMDPHKPLRRREPWYQASPDARQDLASAYDSELSFVDRTLARLSREMHWDRDTLLIVISDHGEELLDRGRHGHGHTLRPEVTRILMMISAPCLGIDPGVIDDTVSLIDVAPTILQLIGEPPPDRSDGRSLVPELLPPPPGTTPGPGRTQQPARDLLLHVARLDLVPSIELWGVIRGRWKLTFSPTSAAARRSRAAPVTGPVHAEHTELYDLLADPRETNDRHLDQPKLVAQLLLALRSFQSEASEEPGEPIRISLDDALMQQLRALGYAEPRGDDGH